MNEWVGEERRQHDEACHSRLRECSQDLKKWTKEQICAATKPGTVKQTMIWSVVLLMLGASSASVYKSFAQSSEVAHNHEAIEEVKKDHETLTQDVNNIKGDIGTIKGYMRQQTQIMRALAKEHGITVDITE